MPRRFYRIIAAEHPAEHDFESNFVRGRAPRGLEVAVPAVHRSISVFERLEEALAVQRRFPQLGTHIAEIELIDGDPEIVIRKVPEHSADSHHSLEGAPTAFLRRVLGVIRTDT